MKVAIAMVQVPFITGGAELHAAMLKAELKKRGHQSDIVTIPFKWYPPSAIVDCMMMGRMMDLSEVNGEKIDRVIALKFPAVYVKHKAKVVWLEHQHRQAYDLWGTKFGDIDKLPEGEALRDFIRTCDTQYLSEAKALYTIAQNTTDRLAKYNQLQAETLYHPPVNHEKLHSGEFGDYIFYASRIDEIKRQRLLVEAAKYIKSPVRCIIAGSGSQGELEYIRALIEKNNLQDKVKLVGFISEEEKIAYYADCLAVYFGAYDEDYGYITLEGMFAHKPVLVHTDAGGPLEFVKDGENGRVLAPDARQIADAIDQLYANKQRAKDMGNAGHELMGKLNINWDYVIDKLIR